MGILKNTVSICQFHITGPVPRDGFDQWLLENLRKRGFHSIDDSINEKSVGWVSIDDIQDSALFLESSVLRTPYVTFAFRKDERKVPKPVLKHMYDQKCNEWLADHPEFQWVPKDRKAEMKDMAYQALLLKTLPIPSVFDAVWNRDSDLLTVTTLGAKPLEEFDTYFRETFEKLGLSIVHPYARAKLVLEKNYHSRLEQFNEATSDSAVDLIKDNRWIGRDFLLWLVYRSLTTSSDYEISVRGPLQTGEKFVAHVNQRIVLAGDDRTGEQRMVLTGPQMRFDEVRAALRNGKEIEEASIMLEREQDEWKLTLKGEQFHFASFKCPKVQIERDDITDEATEREAVFYERMHLLESGLQMFDSVFSEFMKLRVAGEWTKTRAAIKKWYEEN